MGRRPAICNQITGFLPLYKNIVNYTKGIFCIIEGILHNVSADYILGFTNEPQTKWNIKNNININFGKVEMK